MKEKIVVKLQIKRKGQDFIRFHFSDNKKLTQQLQWEKQTFLGKRTHKENRRYDWLRTGLQGPLWYLVGEGSDAFVGDGCQREVVLCVGPETFQNVGGRGGKRFLHLLIENLLRSLGENGLKKNVGQQGDDCTI